MNKMSALNCTRRRILRKAKKHGFDNASIRKSKKDGIFTVSIFHPRSASKNGILASVQHKKLTRARAELMHSKWDFSKLNPE